MHSPIVPSPVSGGIWLPVDELDPWPAWRRFVGVSAAWPGEDVIRALLSKFMRGIWLEDAASLRALAGKPVLFLGNHQVALESLLFAAGLSPILGTPVHAIAKQEHADSWVGQLFGQLYSYPGVTPLEAIFFYRIGDAGALLELMTRVQSVLERQRCGLLVHVAASRVLSCRTPVRTMSSVFIDLALRNGYPIVPVKFHGGLPAAALEGFLDFPVGYGKQSYFVGRPITPGELSAIPLRERRDLILHRINSLGESLEDEAPNAPDPGFRHDVVTFMNRHGVLEHALAVIWAALTRVPDQTPALISILSAIESGRFAAAMTPEGRWALRFAHWLSEGRVTMTVGDAR